MNQHTTPFSTRKLVFSAMIAALYTALCLAFAPICYGPVQFRISEALTILPVFSPIGVWGVSVGCLLSNAVGLCIGTNPLGLLDLLFGTLATVLAALLSHRLRRLRLHGLPVLSSLPPVVCNAVLIGLEFALTTSSGDSFFIAFAVNALYIGLGELLACTGLGLPLFWVLQRSGLARHCFGSKN